MTNNQIAPSQESNQLSDEELGTVAGGGIGEKIGGKLDEVLNAGKDLVGDVVDAGKDFITDIRH